MATGGVGAGKTHKRLKVCEKLLLLHGSNSCLSSTGCEQFLYRVTDGMQSSKQWEESKGAIIDTTNI